MFFGLLVLGGVRLSLVLNIFNVKCREFFIWMCLVEIGAKVGVRIGDVDLWIICLEVIIDLLKV